MKELNVGNAEYIHLKVKKLLKKIAVPEEKHDAKRIEKTKIILNNIIHLVQEERKMLEAYSKEQFQKQYDNTKMLFKKMETNTKDKIGKLESKASGTISGILDFFKGFACPKKRKTYPKIEKEE